MDNATFNQIKLLHAIAGEGSISAGAKKLGITAPSASHALKLLEQKIGVPLFQRTTRQIHLTEAGERLKAQTEQAIFSLENALDEIGDEKNTPKGTVRINTSKIAYKIILQPKISQFCQQYPQVTPEVIIDDGMTDLVANGFDLGIRFGNTLNENVIARQLTAPIRLGLYASRQYLQKFGEPKNPQEMAKHQLLHYRFQTSQQLSPLELVENGQTLAVDNQCQFISNDTDVLLDMAKQGLGVVRMFEPIMQNLPKNYDLQPILQPFWQSYPPLYLYYRPHTLNARRVRALVGFLV